MTLARTLRCSPALLALVLTAPFAQSACQIDKNLGDLDDASGTDTEPEPTSTSDETGAPAPACFQHEGFTCDTPVDCAFEPCGSGPLAEIDENGCLRPRCDGGTCPDGYTCVNLGDWGSCAPSSWECAPYEGECGCGGTADCTSTVSLCVEDEVAPPAACSTLTDEASCLDAGCSAFMLAPRVIVDELAGTCSCGEPEPTCLWFPTGNQSGDAVLTPYAVREGFNGENTVLRLLPMTYDDPPLSWRECTILYNEEICACAQALSCP